MVVVSNSLYSTKQEGNNIKQPGGGAKCYYLLHCV